MSVTVATSWIVRKQRPLRVDRWFRRLQLLSAAAYSLGHGTNDAQKGMGIITTALVAGGLMNTYDVPYWVIICCHLAMGGGTYHFDAAKKTAKPVQKNCAILGVHPKI